jgi:regulator of sigma E protease
MRVERFSLFFPPLIAKVRRGETEYAVGALPLGGYVKITGMNPAEDIPPEVLHRAYYKQPVWKRVVVIAAGPLVNVLVAFLLLLVFFMAQGPAVGVSSTVEAITKDSPAVGVLQPGDRLVAVDGVRGDSERLRAQIATHECAGKQVEGCIAATPAVLQVERDGRLQTLEISPRYAADTDPTTPGDQGRPLVGFAFEPRYEAEGLLEASSSSVEGMWTVTTTTVDRITALVYDAEARKEVSGIVGSYETSRQVIKTSSFETVISIFALISLSLAIINLFPFLPLDGGHIFWAVAEKVRGRAISIRVMERASVVGFMLVLALFAIGLTNDIGRLQGEGFGLR